MLACERIFHVFSIFTAMSYWNDFWYFHTTCVICTFTHRSWLLTLVFTHHTWRQTENIQVKNKYKSRNHRKRIKKCKTQRDSCKNQILNPPVFIHLAQQSQDLCTSVMHTCPHHFISDKNKCRSSLPVSHKQGWFQLSHGHKGSSTVTSPQHYRKFSRDSFGSFSWKKPRSSTGEPGSIHSDASVDLDAINTHITCWILDVKKREEGMTNVSDNQWKQRKQESMHHPHTSTGYSTCVWIFIGNQEQLKYAFIM